MESKAMFSNLRHKIVFFFLFSLIAVAKTEAAPLPPGLLEVHLDIAWEDFMNGDYDCVIIASEKILADTKLLHNDTLTAKAFSIRGNAYRATGQLDSAVLNHQKALKLREKVFGQTTLPVANTLQNLGHCAMDLNDFPKAEAYLQQSLRIRRSLSAPVSVNLASIYSSLGKYYLLTNQINNATTHYRLALRETTAHPTSASRQIPLLTGLAEIYYTHLKLDSALTLQKQAVRIQEDSIGYWHLQNAALRNNLGNTLKLDGHYQEAIAYLESAIEIIEKLTITHNPRKLANSLQNLGSVYQEVQDHELAIQCFERAIRIYQKAPLEFDRELAICKNNLALSYLERGDIDRAQAEADEAVGIFLRAKQDFNPTIATFYRTLAQILQSDVEAAPIAIHFLEKAADILSAYSSEVIQLYHCLLQTGDYLLQQKELDRALFHYERAQNIAEKKLPDQATFDIPIAIRLASAQVQSANLAKARKTLVTVRNKWEEPLQSDRFRVEYLEWLMLMGKIEAKTEQHKAAFDYYLQAFSIKEAILNQITDRKSTVYTRERLLPLYENMLSTCFALAKKDPVYLDIAFQYNESHKAAFLRELIRESNAKTFLDIPPEITAKEKALQQRIDALLQQKYQIEDTELIYQTQLDQLGQLEDTLFALKQRYYALIDDIENSYPQYHELKYQSKPVNLDSLQATLSSNQSLLSYYLGEESIFAFVLRRDTFFMEKLEKAEGLENRVVDLYNAISARPDYDPFAEQHLIDYINSAFDIHQSLIAPIAAGLTEELIIIPDGILNYLPFEALLNKKPDKPHLFRNHSILLKDHTISYAQSSKLWLQNQLKPIDDQLRKGVLSIGPAFSGNVPGLGKLNFNRKEAKNVHRLLGGELYIRAPIDKTKIIDRLDDYAVVHFSTHGMFNPQFPSLSHLILSEQPALDALYVSDLYQLKIQAEMLVLSACETGIGPNYRGEGLMSIARAFTYTGSKSIIASLWSIDDQSTAELFDHFYRSIKEGTAKNKALQLAKLQLIKESAESNKPIKAHPYYWAPINLIGNTEAVDLKGKTSFMSWENLFGWLFPTE